MCLWCNRQVPPAQKTSRNHCPYCFLSLHVDEDEPGDRASVCHAPMIPIEYSIANGKTRVHFMCTACRADHRNKTALDDDMWRIDESITKRKRKYKDMFVE